jgi:hypothetical protein
MAETTFAAIVSQNDANVRKGLVGGVLFAPITATLPTSLTVDSAETPGTPVLQTLPTGFVPLGRLSADGAIFSDAVTASDITGWGALEPIRRDITSDVKTLHVVGLETNKATIALLHDLDESGVPTPDSTTKELQIPRATNPIAKYYRILVLMQDGAAGSEYWFGRMFPRASVTDRGDQSWAAGDTVVSWDVTITAYTDATAGYSSKDFYAGPAWKTGITGAGF